MKDVMVSEEVAREAVALLSTAIGEITENINPNAVLLAVTTGERAEEMRELGRDVVKLSNAMMVLYRLSGIPRMTYYE
jgi:pimeloyl-CoA synthetase